MIARLKGPRRTAILALSGSCLLVGFNLRGQSDLPSSPATGDPIRSPAVQAEWAPESAASRDMVLSLSGLPSPMLKRMSLENPDSPRWHEWLSVYTDLGSVAANVGLPPMMGRYQIQHATNLVFRPAFPLQPQVKYRAILRVPSPEGEPSGPGEWLAFTYHHQPDDGTAIPTRVRQIHPSADVLPENLLKFYIEFSAPMSRGHVYEHIRLLNESGEAVELPFLELDEELWNPSMTRLTLFIDPGRIKRGVKPLEDIGPALEEGAAYTLEINRAWRDARNSPLAEYFRKEFRVGPPDREPPDPKNWILQTPTLHSRDALVVRFPEPLDHALSVRMIRVVDEAGRACAGEVEMDDQDRRWQFTPARPWTHGAYHVVTQKIIEDLAGNNIGKPFEVEASGPIPKDWASGTVSLGFEIQ